jgi:hypothetical protein
VDLTGCSNKVNECLRQLGINSYGALVTMIRDKTGREFQQAVMDADAAKVDPLSEEEKRYLIELRSFTLASCRFFPESGRRMHSNDDELDSQGSSVSEDVELPPATAQSQVDYLRQTDTHYMNTGLTENWDSLVMYNRTSAPPDWVMNPTQRRATGGPWSTRAGPEAFQPAQRPHGELLHAGPADPESFDFDEDQGARDSKYFGMDQHDERDAVPATASTSGLPRVTTVMPEAGNT